MSENGTYISEEKLTVVYEAGGEQIKLTPKIVQDYILGKDSGAITLQEFKLFSELCKARKLNPFLKEAYCIKYGDQPATIIVGKDAILKRAINHPAFDGLESGIIVKNKDTGEIRDREGTFYLPDTEEVVGGWARVYRKGIKYPRYMSISFAEAVQRRKDGKMNAMWAGKSAMMIEKVAKVRALRECFVEELGGMYEADEAEVMNDPIDVTPTDEILSQSEPTETETPIQQNRQEEEVLSLDNF